jgi:TDG/mug DNA glycosylase family protein
MLALGFGLTNIVARTSAAADELSADELRAGAKILRRKLARHHPRILAVVGFGAFRIAFDRPKATGGLQPERIEDTQVWLLPNPSGLNANHSPAELARRFGELRAFVDIQGATEPGSVDPPRDGRR